MEGTMKYIFSKEKWLESANSDLSRGDLSQEDIDNALAVWVNRYDGKPEEQIGKRLPKKWYIETEGNAKETEEEKEDVLASSKENESVNE